MSPATNIVQYIEQLKRVAVTVVGRCPILINHIFSKYWMYDQISTKTNAWIRCKKKGNLKLGTKQKRCLFFFLLLDLTIETNSFFQFWNRKQNFWQTNNCDICPKIFARNVMPLSSFYLYATKKKKTKVIFFLSYFKFN